LPGRRSKRGRGPAATRTFTGGKSEGRSRKQRRGGEERCPGASEKKKNNGGGKERPRPFEKKILRKKKQPGKGTWGNDGVYAKRNRYQDVKEGPPTGKIPAQAKKNSPRPAPKPGGPQNKNVETPG